MNAAYIHTYVYAKPICYRRDTNVAIIDTKPMLDANPNLGAKPL